VSILVADAIFDVVDELKACVDNEIPIIVVPGSIVCDNMIKLSSGDDDGSGS
jgi:predicted secreted protein